MEIQELITRYQARLFELAYRMTGEVAVSEDIVQESLIHWTTHEHGDVENPPAYLAKTVMNRSLNHLAKVKRQREIYKGTWLPEPILSHDFRQIDAQMDVSYGFMILLEKLTPAERAVFLLKESFDVDNAELTKLLTLTEANIRQLYHRAKEKLATTKKRYHIDSQHQQMLVHAFTTASQSGNINDFVQLLKNDIIVYSDGGGKATAALHTLVGIEHVVAFLSGLARKNMPNQYVEPVLVNGGPGLLIFQKDTHALSSVMAIDMDENGVSGIFFIRNPDKLPLLARGQQ